MSETTADKKIRVFVRRPNPLGNLDLVEINKFNANFDIEMWYAIGDGLPQLAHVQHFNPVLAPLPPPPNPAGILYDSNTNGLWANGKARTVTDYDKLLPKPYCNGNGLICAASGGPYVEIDGNGVATLKAKKGGHPRFYIDSVNYNTQVVFGFRFNDDHVQNSTQQNMSRHQEEDKNEQDNENAFGGTNHEIDLEGQKAGLKIELYHTPDGGEHINFNDKPLPKPIKVGQWVNVRNTDLVNKSKKEIHMISEIDWLDGNGFRKVNEALQKDCPSYFMDDRIKKISYRWWRVNNNAATDGISVKNIQSLQLPFTD